MKANIVDLQTLFEQRVSYRIPQFQRAYAWGKERQWEPLWIDVRNVAERFLEREAGKKIRSHFLGAIVLQQQKSPTGQVIKRLVIDGQQRLTTLQLLIKATEQAFQSQDFTARVRRLRELTTNPESHWGGNSANQTKIQQSNTDDQMAFQDAIREHYSERKIQPRDISQAYGYFQAEVSEWLDSKPEDQTSRADALEETLTKHLKIAVIDLDEDEKPHIIFETLNARGEPLTQSDLIKNIVMYKAHVIDDVQMAKKLWGTFESDQWWRENTNDKLKRIHIDRFLHYWIVMRTRKDVNANRVVSEFRDYIQKKNDKDEESTIQTITKEIKDAGRIYKDLEEGKFLGIEIFLKRMKAIEFSTYTPLLLWLYTSDIPKVQRKQIVEVLESYVVRRMLYGLSTQGLYEFFINLLDKLHGKNPIHTYETIISHLSAQSGSYVWPDDQMLCKHLLAKPIKRPARQKMVLEAIEMSLRSEKSEPLGVTKKLTVEHIMPQKWENDWPPPMSTSVSNEDEVESRHQTIETIGNLTLIAGKLNSSLSNGPWIEKREELRKHSSLFLNKTLLDDAPDVWDEEAIKSRCQYLAEKITEIWPSAEKFAESAA